MVYRNMLFRSWGDENTNIETEPVTIPYAGWWVGFGVQYSYLANATIKTDRIPSGRGGLAVRWHF